MARFSLLLLFAAVLGSLLFVYGCGRKGDPKPPEAFAPSAVGFYTARGQVDSVILSWQAPKITASGDVLENLEFFSIKRAIHDSQKMRRFKDIGEVGVAGLASSGERQAGSASPAASQAAITYSFADRDIVPGSVYDYRVVPVNSRGVEGQSAATLRVTFLGESSIVERLE